MSMGYTTTQEDQLNDEVITPLHLVQEAELPVSGASLRSVDGAVLWLEPVLRRLHLVAPASHPLLADFNGEAEVFRENLQHLTAPLSPSNAAALRRALPNLTPRPLGLATSAGFGDRLGLATPGHVRALQRILLQNPTANILPIFAQQSAREITRTRRSPREVLDDATWGAFEAGWTDVVGADADHLKTTADIDRWAIEGFSFYTIDPGDRVDDSATDASPAELIAKIEELPWTTLETSQAELFHSYQNYVLEAEGVRIAFDRPAVARAAARYGPALAHVVTMYHHLKGLQIPFELEISVDETSTPTTLLEHAFLALELNRLGVHWVSLAPRLVGRFEKGVDFRGDMGELIRTLHGHARLARMLGPYKLSLHSGSDKFRVYEPIVRATRGCVHLKTAGTSYLEALRVVASQDPALFRLILDLARERFADERASYHVSARASAVPNPRSLTDEELPQLLDIEDTRQVLHVTFGSTLDNFGDELKACLQAHAEVYSEGLARHFERHLRPFVVSEKGADRAAGDER